MNEQELKEWTAWADDMYRFVFDIMDHVKKPHEYDVGIVLNMVEMHTLALIAKQPGISVGDVAKYWNRTMSAASRNVERLADKGYIEKRKQDGNAKTVHLYATELGRKLAEHHSAFDAKEMEAFAKFIDQRCTAEDLAHFVRVMKIIQEFYRLSGD